MYLKAGVIDQQDAVEEMKPKAEIFTKRRISWVQSIEDAFQKAEMD